MPEPHLTNWGGVGVRWVHAKQTIGPLYGRIAFGIQRESCKPIPLTGVREAGYALCWFGSLVPILPH